MKLVKSLLLGSAAGLMAVTGSMAADLPSRKAAPVDYVRVCSGGAGHTGFIVPGSDNCLMISGRVRADYQIGNRYSKADDSYGIVASSRLNLDYRQQTSIGTVRAYVRFNMNNTAGRSATSSTPATAARQTNAGNTFARLVPGLRPVRPRQRLRHRRSRSVVLRLLRPRLLLELRRHLRHPGHRSQPARLHRQLRRRSHRHPRHRRPRRERSDCSWLLLLQVSSSCQHQLLYQGRSYPDLVGNLRLAQGWGTAQLGVAVRNVAVTNYRSLLLLSGSKTGFALLGGVTINLPSIGPSSAFVFEGTYTRGMMNYIGLGGSPFASATQRCRG
jgi:hypothetical protein